MKKKKKNHTDKDAGIGFFFLPANWPSAYDRLYITQRDQQSRDFCIVEINPATWGSGRGKKWTLQNPIYGQCEGRRQAVIPISRITLNMTNLLPHFQLKELIAKPIRKITVLWGRSNRVCVELESLMSEKKELSPHLMSGKLLKECTYRAQLKMLCFP